MTSVLLLTWTQSAKPTCRTHLRLSCFGWRTLTSTASIEKSRVMPSLLVASSKKKVPEILNKHIVSVCDAAIKDHGAFTIALSGGSLVSFLSSLPQAFAAASVDPCFDKWYILLADERCVPRSSEDSNLGALEKQFLPNISVPSAQIFGIQEDLLDGEVDIVAEEYQKKVEKALAQTGGTLDLAVLGFGPDGHTCSLFPDHQLLRESTKLVAALDDSPKPPSKRITLMYRVLNHMTQQVIFCGAGASKAPILDTVFDKLEPRSSKNESSVTHYEVTMVEPPPYPCAMVRPELGSITWVVDADAVSGLVEAKAETSI